MLKSELADPRLLQVSRLTTAMRRKEKEISKLNAKANKVRKQELKSEESAAAVAIVETVVKTKAQDLCVGDVIQILWEADMKWSVT